MARGRGYRGRGRGGRGNYGRGSGRSSGRSNGRGSSGRSGGRGNKPNPKIYRFAPLNHGLNVATNDEICEKLYNEILKEHTEGGKDMVNSLKNGVRIALDTNKPVLVLESIAETDTPADKAKAYANNTTATTEYNAAYKTWDARRRHLLELESAVYALILTKYCTYKMQDKIKELPQFETEIEQDPYKLLEAAKLLTHQTTLKKTPDYMWMYDP